MGLGIGLWRGQMDLTRPMRGMGVLLECIGAASLPREFGGDNPFEVEPLRCDRSVGRAFAQQLQEADGGGPGDDLDKEGTT